MCVCAAWCLRRCDGHGAVAGAVAVADNVRCRMATQHYCLLLGKDTCRSSSGWLILRDPMHWRRRTRFVAGRRLGTVISRRVTSGVPLCRVATQRCTLQSTVAISSSCSGLCLPLAVMLQHRIRCEIRGDREVALLASAAGSGVKLRSTAALRASQDGESALLVACRKGFLSVAQWLVHSAASSVTAERDAVRLQTSPRLLRSAPVMS